MAYDKVVDSVKLDGAIKSTANTIRSKTGKSDKIIWDESVGFSDAIKTQNKSVTPKASSQTVKPDAGYIGLGQVTVNGDSDLKAVNIAKGVNIFGVTGTLESGSRVATGTFTTNGGWLYNMPITISGLGFKPTRVIFYHLMANGHEDWIQNKGIEVGDSSGAYLARYYYEEYDEDAEEYYEDWCLGSPSTGVFTITLNSDGFKVGATGYGESQELNWHGSGTKYQYFAIG